MPVYSYMTAAGAKRYRVLYRDPQHHQRSKRGFRRKVDAEDFEAQQRVDKRTGAWIDPARGGITVGELGETWMAQKKVTLKTSAYRALEVDWRLRVNTKWGSTPVDKLEYGAVADWIASIAAERSATVVIRAYGILNGILDDAVRNRRIRANVARGVTMPKKKPKRRYYLNAQQVALLALQTPQGWPRALVLTLAYTGLRWGEVAALRVGDLDLERHQLHVTGNSVFAGRDVDETAPKSYRLRVVPLPEFLEQILVEIVKGRPQNERIFGDGWNPIPRAKSDHGWFFNAVKAAQSIDDTFPPRLMPHELRHTAASLAVSSGANVKAVQRMLGHRSAAVTLDTYSDLFSTDLQDVSERLNQVALGTDVAKLLPNKAPKRPESA